MTQEEAVTQFTALKSYYQLIPPNFREGSDYRLAINHDPATCQHTELEHQHWIHAQQQQARRKAGGTHWRTKIHEQADGLDLCVRELLAAQSVTAEQGKHLLSIVHEYRTSIGTRDRMAALVEYGKLRDLYTQKVRIEASKPPSEVAQCFGSWMEKTVEDASTPPS